MQAIAIERCGGVEHLALMELPLPQPGAEEILVRVRAAGVNLVDTMYREGYGQNESFPRIMGSDFAGEVVQIGREVTAFVVGDEVFGYKLGGNGTYAQYATVPAAYAAKKPTSLDFIHAAALPCVGLTAYEALVETLKVMAGETLLITSAAGGVGSVAVQVAADLGIRVIATASARNREYLHALGATEVIDYQTEDFVQAVRAFYPNGIDVVLTCIAGETKQRCPDVLRDGGRFAWISGEERLGPPMQRLIQGTYSGGRPDSGVLTTLAHLVDQRRLQVSIEEVFPLEQAAKAHTRIEEGHVRGKLVVSVP